MGNYIYVRGLRHADHTVFCVEEGQKNYWDPIFNVRVPYSSGQQVKRSIIDAIMDELNVKPSPVTFISKINTKGQIGEGEVLSACDPRYFDQLLGGWMHAVSGSEERTLKRRSPFSISAMRPIHPLLGGLKEEKLSFDRSDKPHLHKVVVKDKDGKKLTKEEIKDRLQGTDRSLFRKWIQGSSRAYGIFVYDIAIDLRTLFCVSTNQFEPEIRPDLIDELKLEGWVESENVFGSCLVMPKEERDKLIPAIANALVNWRISSNQARTFSLMETLALSVSRNANHVASSLRAELIDDSSERQKAKLVIDDSTSSNLFVTPSSKAFSLTNIDSTNAVDLAIKELEEMLGAFDYEKQMV